MLINKLFDFHQGKWYSKVELSGISGGVLKHPLPLFKFDKVPTWIDFTSKENIKDWFLIYRSHVHILLRNDVKLNEPIGPGWG